MTKENSQNTLKKIISLSKQAHKLNKEGHYKAAEDIFKKTDISIARNQFFYTHFEGIILVPRQAPQCRHGQIHKRKPGAVG